MLTKKQKREQDKIIKTNDLRKAYWFMKENKEADLARLDELVIVGDDPKWSYYFARDFEGERIDDHCRRVINGGNSKYKYLFAVNIDISHIPLDTMWAVGS